MTQRIFVYGTLKRGLSNARHLDGQCFIGETRTQPFYRMVNCGGYPGMVLVSQDGVSVRGEIWDVDAACREKLDDLEGVDVGMYELATVKLLPPFDHEVIMTYLYKLPVSGLEDVGDEWRE